MKKPKTIASISLALALAAGLAGCGTGNKAAEKSADAGSSGPKLGIRP